MKIKDLKKIFENKNWKIVERIDTENNKEFIVLNIEQTLDDDGCGFFGGFSLGSYKDLIGDSFSDREARSWYIPKYIKTKVIKYFEELENSQKTSSN